MRPLLLLAVLLGACGTTTPGILPNPHDGVLRFQGERTPGFDTRAITVQSPSVGFSSPQPPAQLFVNGRGPYEMAEAVLPYPPDSLAQESVHVMRYATADSCVDFGIGRDVPAAVRLLDEQGQVFRTYETTIAFLPDCPGN